MQFCFTNSIVVAILGILRFVTCEEDCNKSPKFVCQKEFEALKSDQRFYYASSTEVLLELCQKQIQAVNCVDEYAKDCLNQDSRHAYEILTKGSQDFLKKKLCSEASHFHKSYLEHAQCIKQVAPDLDECTKRYKEAENRLDLEEDHKTLLRKTCCLYFGNIECSVNATEGICGPPAGVLVKELFTYLGGAYLNDKCSPYLKVCESSAAKSSLQFVNSWSILLIVVLLRTFLVGILT